MIGPLPPWTLAAYFAAYVLFLFVGRSVAVWRRTGVNPYVLPRSDDAHGYVARAFRFVLPLCAAAAFVPWLAPGADAWLGPFPVIEHPAARTVGWGLLIASFAWIGVAQAQMGASWRIGIDEARSTDLVAQGLFRVSRNPIFLGMRVTLVGLFLVDPSAATMLVLVVGEILVQVQVRLEEDHLAALHGDAYAEYRRRVRRWL